MPQNVKAKQTDFVASLAKGLEVLQCFNRDRPELTLSEVAELTQITPAAARRSLLTLQVLGFVTTHGRRFLLTPRVLRLSEAFLSSVSMQEVMQQFLQMAVDATGDSSSVAVLDGTEILYVASVSAQRKLTPTIGTRYPAYCTSLGRAILAHSPTAVVDRVLGAEPPAKLTEHTETDPARIREKLALARETGITGIQDELAYAVVSVAMPILDRQGVAIGAVNCSTSPLRTTMADMLTSRSAVLRDVRDRISLALDQHPVLLHSVLGARRPVHDGAGPE
ncbi:IclR family transcriptional regulator C-terminal domain-containing protein [Streptomyces sp. NPDC056161]|uniref:IclR family transcriptional regulator domain-containing protein n=1 Tax=Streptomyces sp. NPDC056161 TaxID=3345732 RepID=UPI0035D8F1F4